MGSCIQKSYEGIHVFFETSNYLTFVFIKRFSKDQEILWAYSSMARIRTGKFNLSKIHEVMWKQSLCV